jgi:hypothetical protein
MGQSNVIATVIMVGIAITVALGFISYVIPLVVNARVEQSISMQASRIGSDVSVGVASSLNNSVGRVVVFGVSSKTSDVGLYLAVLGFKDNYPVEAADIALYTMAQSVAAANTTDGWSLVSCVVVPGENVRVYVQGEFYKLSLFRIESVKVCPLGIIKPGNESFYRVEITSQSTNTTYLGVVLANINGDYTSVAYFNTG